MAEAGAKPPVGLYVYVLTTPSTSALTSRLAASQVYTLGQQVVASRLAARLVEVNKKRQTVCPPPLLKAFVFVHNLLVFAKSGVQERAQRVLEELGEYLSQRLKIVEAMLQNLVNDFPINVQVIVN
jgi:hypothetical protein